MKNSPEREKALRKSYEANCIQRIADTHKGEDFFVMGTGTSLSGFPWEKMNDKTTIALNDAIFAKDFTPTYHLFSDVNIWRRYSHMEWKPPCKMVCQRHARKMFIDSRNCKFNKYLWQFDISSVPEFNKGDQRLYVRRTVATGAINMAYKLGARRVFLLGVDGYKKKNAYYHDGNVKRPERRKESRLEDGRIVQDRHEHWMKDMTGMSDGFKKNNVFQGKYPDSGVYNLNKLSTITVWEKVHPEKVLGFTW